MTRLLFFFNDTATTEIYTLSLHDALPILWVSTLHDAWRAGVPDAEVEALLPTLEAALRWIVEEGDADGDGFLEYLDLSGQDRKSTRLNSSHANISYAVFCLKKKKRPTTFY